MVDENSLNKSIPVHFMNGKHTSGYFHIVGAHSYLMGTYSTRFNYRLKRPADLMKYLTTERDRI